MLNIVLCKTAIIYSILLRLQLNMVALMQFIHTFPAWEFMTETATRQRRRLSIICPFIALAGQQFPPSVLAKVFSDTNPLCKNRFGRQKHHFR